MYFFNKPYNKQEFQGFLENQFLPDDFRIGKEEVSLPPGANRITEIEKIGEVPSFDNLVVYEIHHKSENDPRVSLTRESFSLLKHYGEKNVLAVYVSENSDNYRFSLITSGFELTKKGQAKREFSNPRRFSFYLGPDAKVKTPVMYLKQKGRVVDFSDLQSRFDIQVLTKEFYKELSSWYFWALKNVRFPKDAESKNGGKNTAVIRLIARLVFIWFMKKKGLIPGHLFDLEKVENILVDLQDDESTYYKAILQNLFFATLNTPVKERRFREQKNRRKGWNKDFGKSDIYRYEKYFQEPEKILENFKGIPFLNGGLFECLDKKKQKPRIYIDGFSRTKKNHPEVPNFLFFSNDRKVDLSEFFETGHKSESVRGLINILNDYNFTIDENTPIDQEVSLDPELLGQIFENLLASYNPETSTTARKATGSYYTPRPIVEFMVNESLKQYFLEKLKETERDNETLKGKINSLLSYYQEKHEFNKEQVNILIQAIEELKIIDPAVGSGAFPMGILQKLVLVLGKLDPDNKKLKANRIKEVKENIPDIILRRKFLVNIEDYFETNQPDYARKLHLIQRCIYGVDIQPIAIQIAKLRFFISLLVDESIEKEKPNKGIEPLPNMETKFISANSLIKLEKSARMSLFVEGDKEITSLENKLQKLRSDYFNASFPEEKNKIRLQDKEIRHELVQALKKIGFGSVYLKAISGWDPYNTNVSASFFDPEWMFGVKAFDIVIANPPYIKEYTDRKAFDGLRNSPYYQGKMDLWYVFACMGIDLLKDNSGILTFIAQNNWVTSYGASKMRNKVINGTQILSLIDFGDFKIFQAGIQTMVMMFKKSISLENYSFDYRRLRGNDLELDDVVAILNKDENGTAEYLVPKIKRNKLRDKKMTFSNLEIESILEKILSKANFHLDPKKEVAQGIVPNPDVIGTSNLKKIPKTKIIKYEIKTGDGVFTIQKGFFRTLNKYEKTILKPLYEPTDLDRYCIKNVNTKEIIYLTKENDPKRIPILLNHLEKFKEIMEERRENKSGRLKYYHLHWPRNDYFFESGPKILSIRKCARPTFTYTEDEAYVMMSMNVIKTVRIDTKYLIALLNSKLMTFWLRHRGKMQGNNYQIDKEPIIDLPILETSQSKQRIIINTVDQIIKTIKEDGKNPKIFELEKQIDHLVYMLYGLTPEEIEIVEKA